jgi:hypothetical protein
MVTRRCAYEPCSNEFTTANMARKYCSDRCRMRAFQERQRIANSSVTVSVEIGLAEAA